MIKFYEITVTTPFNYVITVKILPEKWADSEILYIVFLFLIMPSFRLPL